MSESTEPTLTNSENGEDEVLSPFYLWKSAVGRVFKFISKSYGVRTVTYTQVKAVKEVGLAGDFEIEVFCAEVIARVLMSRRTHSSVCKEGVIQQDPTSIVTPDNFGDECALEEFEKLANSILTHATTTLDVITQGEHEEPKVNVAIDLPHLQLTEMEASLLRNLPFLVGDIYFLSANSRKAAYESINEELRRAARNTRLTDASDPVYVAQKNEAVVSLRAKLARPEAMIPVQSASPAPGAAAYSSTTNPPREKSTPATPDLINYAAEAAAAAKPVAAKGGRLFFTLTEKKSNISLALRGKPSAATLSWERHRPGKEGVIYHLGKDSGPLEFTRWAHVSGRPVADEESVGKNIRDYFNSPDGGYGGPDPQEIYPLFTLEADPANRGILGG